MTETESDRNPLMDIARELSRLGEEVGEGDIDKDKLQERLWALSGRLDPYDPQDQVRRVGVVVFAEVKARTDRDAGSLAEMAIREKLSENGNILVVPFRTDPIPVRIGGVMELGMAEGNGYTWARVTAKAWDFSPDGPWDGAMPS